MPVLNECANGLESICTFRYTQFVQTKLSNLKESARGAYLTAELTRLQSQKEVLIKDYKEQLAGHKPMKVEEYREKRATLDSSIEFLRQNIRQTRAQIHTNNRRFRDYDFRS